MVHYLEQEKCIECLACARACPIDERVVGGNAVGKVAARPVDVDAQDLAVQRREILAGGERIVRIDPESPAAWEFFENASRAAGDEETALEAKRIRRRLSPSPPG